MKGVAKDPTKSEMKQPHMTVRGINKDVANRFHAACKVQGRTMGSVLEELMSEYASRYIK